MYKISYREGHKDMISILNANFDEISHYAAGVSVIQVASLVLLSANWSLVSGLYEYNLSNTNIKSTSIVDVIPDNADIAIVKAAQILPKTVSSTGAVKLYSTNAPASNIGITINIIG